MTSEHLDLCDFCCDSLFCFSPEFEAHEKPSKSTFNIETSNIEVSARRRIDPTIMSNIKDIDDQILQNHRQLWLAEKSGRKDIKNLNSSFHALLMKRETLFTDLYIKYVQRMISYLN